MIEEFVIKHTKASVANEERIVIKRIWMKTQGCVLFIRYDCLFEYPILLGLIVYRLNYT